MTTLDELKKQVKLLDERDVEKLWHLMMIHKDDLVSIIREFDEYLAERFDEIEKELEEETID